MTATRRGSDKSGEPARLLIVPGHTNGRVSGVLHGSSWINQVERWFAYLTAQKIRRGVHKSVQALEADIRGWIENWNQNPRPFSWAKTCSGRILGRRA